MEKCMIRGQETYKMSQSGSMEVLKKNRDKIITTKTYTDGGISRGQGANWKSSQWSKLEPSEQKNVVLNYIAKYK